MRELELLEFSIARKYLTPRWRQLSVSIISLISILVIALVVWLIVVFFSVTYGLEKSWISKLIALTAPVRVTPTDAYYRSYYYQVDSISEQADYSAKTIKEKSLSPFTDPYNPLSDEEPPAAWPKPDRDADGKVKDLVKLAFAAIDSLPPIQGLTAQDFEMTLSNLHLQLVRKSDSSILQQTSYLGSFDQNNPSLSKALIPLSLSDLNNLYSMIGIAANNTQENDSDSVQPASQDEVQSQLRSFFDFVQIKELKTPFSLFWTLSKNLWPENAIFKAILLEKKEKRLRYILPKEIKALSSFMDPNFLSKGTKQCLLSSNSAIKCLLFYFRTRRGNESPNISLSRL